MNTQNSPSYTEIASNYKLWMEYADPSGLDSEQDFNTRTIQENIDFLIACFGPEIVRSYEHP